jgi:hypothetical protein
VLLLHSTNDVGDVVADGSHGLGGRDVVVSHDTPAQMLAGRLPPKVLREVQDLLSSHRSLATMAFHATLDHAFPGTLEKCWIEATAMRRGWDEGTDEYVLVDVTDVRVLSRYVTELTFDDGSVKVIDLEDWLTGPDFGWLLEDYPAFCEVAVDSESGTIRFSNGAEFSPAGLYLAAKAAVPA